MYTVECSSSEHERSIALTCCNQFGIISSLLVGHTSRAAAAAATAVVIPMF